jgi:hypothetical protein
LISEERRGVSESGELHEEEGVLVERHERELVEDAVPRGHGHNGYGGQDHLHPGAPTDPGAPRNLSRRCAPSRLLPPAPVHP